MPGLFLMRRSKGHGLRAQAAHVRPLQRQGHGLELALLRQAVGEAVVHLAQLGASLGRGSRLETR